jgi:hypothetical protein
MGYVARANEGAESRRRPVLANRRETDFPLCLPFTRIPSSLAPITGPARQGCRGAISSLEMLRPIARSYGADTFRCFDLISPKEDKKLDPQGGYSRSATHELELVAKAFQKISNEMSYEGLAKALLRAFRSQAS